MLKRYAPIFLLCLLAVVTHAAETTVTGKCIGVSDGDTITVLKDKQQIKVRLAGIDCPESHQDYGSKAKKYTSALTFGKQVTLKITDTDRYGRKVATVLVADKNVNLLLVQAGLAWHYKAYSKDKALAEAEQTARAAELGLWSQANPTAPWDFRKGKKTRAAPKAKTTTEAIEKGFWLNTGSNARHNQSCRYFNNTKRGRACGKSEGKACGICGG